MARAPGERLTQTDFRAIFEGAPANFVVLDRAFTIVAVSDAYLQVTGRRREDLVGRDVFDAFPDNPDDPRADGGPNLRRSLQRVLQRRRRDAMPLQRHDMRDPATGQFRERYWEPVNVPILDEEGEVAYVVQRTEDVTDALLGARREAQQIAAIRSSERQLEAAQLMASLGSWEYRVRDRSLTVSAGFRELYGMEPDEEADPGRLLERIHPDDLARVQAQFDDVLAGRPVPDIEYRIRRGEEWLTVARRSEPLIERGEITGLRATIQDVSEFRRLEQERERLLAELEVQALTDALTGLPNRRAWDQELHRELARAGREGTPLAVAIVDLDHFKRFNDAHGHPAGDALLAQAATLWRRDLRETDTLARYGGEEFALALPGSPPQQAHATLERLVAATPGGQTVSAGLAMWDGAEDAEALLARADAALYAAKNAGRNRICVASGPD
jgi:diguanylate cyclase (GGDEF)-like protein/PAS domain S-box-containing protein